MGKTSIEWTDFSINPIRARLQADPAKVGHYCEKVSAGCAHCYASRLQARFGLPTFGAGQHREAVKLWLDADRLDQVLRRRKPTRWFWCDMTDLFGEWVPDEWIDVCFAVMAATPQHTHQVLTKRPERMREWFARREWSAAIPGTCLEVERGVGDNYGEDFVWLSHEEHDAPWPLPNVWLGVSVEDQAAADARIPPLLAIPAAVRFLSCEPLLGMVDLGLSVADCDCCERWPSRWVELPQDVSGDWPVGHGTIASAGVYRAHSNRHGALSVVAQNGELLGIKPAEFHALGSIAWVIAGGESGPNARPCHPDWVRSLRDQCQAADVPFFFKQWGEWAPLERHHVMVPSGNYAYTPSGEKVTEHDSRPLHVWHFSEHESDGDCFSAVRVGKHAAGRLLDGREWSEFPHAVEAS